MPSVDFPWDGSPPIKGPLSIGEYIEYLAKRMGCDSERFVVEGETPGQVIVAMENPTETEIEKLKAIMEEAPVSVSIQQVAVRGER